MYNVQIRTSNSLYWNTFCRSEEYTQFLSAKYGYRRNGKTRVDDKEEGETEGGCDLELLKTFALFKGTLNSF